MRIATEGSTLEISSMSRIELKKLDPVPPYFSGISILISPMSKIFLINSGSMLCLESISETKGAISANAKVRTASLNIFFITGK